MCLLQNISHNVGQSEKMCVVFDVRSCLYLDRGHGNMNVCPRHTEQENSPFKSTLEEYEAVMISSYLIPSVPQLGSTVTRYVCRKVFLRWICPAHVYSLNLYGGFA